MSDCFLRYLFFRKWLDQLIMDKQSINIFQFFTCGVRWFELNGTAFFAVSYAYGYRFFYQLFFVL